MKTAASIIAYIAMFGFWGYITFISVKAKINKVSKSYPIGLLIVWLGLIFNIIYTGLLGWNFTPASDLESLLDGISFFIQMIGIVLMYIGLNKFIKK